MAKSSSSDFALLSARVKQFYQLVQLRLNNPGITKRERKDLEEIEIDSDDSEWPYISVMLPGGYISFNFTKKGKFRSTEISLKIGSSTLNLARLTLEQAEDFDLIFDSLLVFTSKPSLLTPAEQLGADIARLTGQALNEQPEP